MPKLSKAHAELFELLASIKDPAEAKLLAEDLLTPQEVDSIAERWQLVQELVKGTTQRDIVKKLKISIAKVTRGSRMLRYGDGGFAHFLKKLGKTAKR
jgi:TrpR family trp operon transcriptional repressor